MKIKRWTMMCVLMLGLCLSTLFIFAGPGKVAAAEAQTYYALCGNFFTVPEYKADIIVYNPAGGIVKTDEKGSFRVTTAGEYTIVRAGETDILRAFAVAPELTITTGEYEEEYLTGYFFTPPAAVAACEIGNYTDYSVRVLLQDAVVAELAPGESFIPVAEGDYKVEYTFTDLFGLETKKTVEIRVNAWEGIVVQNIPQNMKIGERVDLSEVYGFYEGKVYPCAVVLEDSTGSLRIHDNEFIPRATGTSKLTFYCNILGQRFDRTILIEVESDISGVFPGYGLTEISEGTAFPSSSNAGDTGVYIGGNSGTTFHYAKTIDLKKLSQDREDIIRFQPLAEAGSISEIRVTMQDVADASNTLTVYWWQNPWLSYLSYMLVEYDGYSIAISNESDSSGTVRPDYGSVVFHNFGNADNSGCVPFNFRYDWEENAIFCMSDIYTPDYKVLDLDNTEELSAYFPFEGFLSAEVYLCVELVTCDNAGVVISEIGGESVAEEKNIRNEGVLQIIPSSDGTEGIVGCEYTLPSVQKEDILFGTVECSREILLWENGRFVSQNIYGDSFIPEKSGLYRVIFSTFDNFGNPISKQTDFTIIDQPRGITISYDDSEIISVLDVFELKQADVHGGSGVIVTNYEVSYAGRVFEMKPGDTFFVDVPGEIRIRIISCDHFGGQQEKTYLLPVGTDVQILQVEKDRLTCREGENYEIPSAYLLDYNFYGEEGFTTPADVFIDGELVEKIFPVRHGQEDFTVEVRSKDGLLSEAFTIHVIPSETDTIADYLVYDREHVQTEFYDTGLNFIFEDDFALSMPYALPYAGLSCKFTLLEESFHYERLYLDFVSFADSRLRIRLNVAYEGEGKANILLDGSSYPVDVEYGTYNELSMYKGKKYASLVLQLNSDGTLLASGKTVCIIRSYESGQPFNGFGGAPVFLSIAAEEVLAKSSFVLNYVKNQSFNLYTQDQDNTPGYVEFSEQIQAEYDIGESIVLPAILAGDVLSPVVDVKVSVRLPDKTYLYRNSSLQNPISITFESYGYYQIQFQTMDGNYNEGQTTFRILVADKTPPEVSFVKAGDLTFKKGASYTVPNIEVSDNSGVDEAALSCYIYLFTPDVEYILVEQGEKIVLDKTGTYRLIAYVMDEEGNSATTSLTLEVKK